MTAGCRSAVGFRAAVGEWAPVFFRAAVGGWAAVRYRAALGFRDVD